MLTSTAERPLAAVTGASSGIGYELGRQFARAGFDLIVCAHDAEIHAVAKAFEVEGASVVAIQCDLREHEQVEAYYGKIVEQARPLEAIAINASVTVVGDFARETDLRDELGMIRLNVLSMVHLAKLAARDMAARGRGRISITASAAGTLPTPLQAVYGATKAFAISFAASLRRELKPRGVSVTALLAGPTDSEAFERSSGAATGAARLVEKNDPAEVARQGFEGLMAGADRVYAASSPGKTLQGTAARIVPEPVSARLQEGLLRERGPRGSGTEPRSRAR